jgi:hypothetical protein
MAGNAVIGALRVVLGADTAALDKGLSDAQKRLAAFGDGVAKAGMAAAAAFGAATVALGVSIKHAIDEADKLGKMSQKIGVPVEDLSALKHAADLSGVSIDSLGKAVGKLSKNMVEAATNPTSEAAKAFKAVGVSLRDADGSMRSSTSVIADLAGRYEGLKDGAGKTALSMALFGKAGADLIPLLNAGKSGLQDMITEAAELGIVIDNQTAKSAEAFNDNLTRLGKAKDGLVLKITAQLLPALQRMSEVMVDVAKDGEAVKAIADTLATGFRGVVSVVVQVVTAAQRLGAELVALKDLVVAFATTGSGWSDRMKEAWAKFRAEEEKTKSTFETLGKVTTKFWQDSETKAKASAGTQTKALADINYGALATKSALDKFIDTQTRALAGQQAEIQTFGALAGQKEALRLQLQALAVAKANDTTISAQQQLQLDQLKQKTADYALTLAGLQMTQSNLTPLQAYQAELQKIQALYDSGKISLETFTRATESAAERMGVGWQAMGASLASFSGSMSQLAGSFAKNNRAMGIASKAFGIAQAVINTQMAVTKALAIYGPTPLGFAAVAAAVAQGAASVATIASQGFAMGGALRVPGGQGGGDKVPFSAMLEPGELVEISSNRAGGYQSGSRAIMPPITLIGDTFSRASVEKLLVQINDLVGDGAALKIRPA